MPNMCAKFATCDFHFEGVINFLNFPYPEDG
jgi:hypothetical protein